MGLRPAKLRDASLWVRMAALAAVTAALLVAVGPAAWAISGTPGVLAALAAAGVCAAGAAAAMTASQLLQAPSTMLIGLLAGTAFRIGPPLALALVARLRGGPLLDCGLLYYLLIFYPVTLAAEIAMSFPKASPLSKRL